MPPQPPPNQGKHSQKRHPNQHRNNPQPATSPIHPALPRASSKPPFKNPTPNNPQIRPRLCIARPHIRNQHVREPPLRLARQPAHADSPQRAEKPAPPAPRQRGRRRQQRERDEEEVGCREPGGGMERVHGEGEEEGRGEGRGEAGCAAGCGLRGGEAEEGGEVDGGWGRG